MSPELKETQKLGNSIQLTQFQHSRECALPELKKTKMERIQEDRIPDEGRYSESQSEKIYRFLTILGLPHIICREDLTQR